MKTAKLVIGIVSIVLFLVIMFQSCAVGFVNAVEQNETDASGGAGVFVALIFLIAGVVGISTRKSKGGGITVGVFYIVAALFGFGNLGTFGDLVVWAFLGLVFGIVFIIGSVKMPKNPKPE
jgi:hypothetical protein